MDTLCSLPGRRSDATHSSAAPTWTYRGPCTPALSLPAPHHPPHPACVLVWGAESAQLLQHPRAVRSFGSEATGGGCRAAKLGAPAAPLGPSLASVTSLACHSRQGLLVGGTQCSGQAQPCNPAQIWMAASSSWLFSQTILLESNRLRECQETRPPSNVASMK